MLASAALGGTGAVAIAEGVVGVGSSRGRVFALGSVCCGASSSSHCSARQAPVMKLGRPKNIATNPYERPDFPHRRQEWRLTKIRLASKSYIMRPMHPPCGEHRLRRESTQALSLRSMCQEGGPPWQLRANVAWMLGVASSAPEKAFLRDASRRGQDRACTRNKFAVTVLEISA